ncbi:MAG: damage-inducible protein DinB [Acidobacteria bacterium]|nr:damage-inducible protein DinB [Acidobacteriota bacterium]
MHGKDSTGLNFWQNFSLEECEDLARETAENYARLLKQFDEESLNTRVEYKTSKKVAHKNTFRELLSHVLLHPATHRGNIVLKLREENFTPPQIDYIIYLRETKGV